MRKGLTASLFLIFSLFGGFAEYNSLGIPDSSEIRKGLQEKWFEAPLEEVRMNRPEIRENGIGEKFQIRLEETEDTFNVFVSPYARLEVDVYSDKGKHTEVQDVYPGDGIGSWVLVRDKKSGKPLFVRWYFTRDSEVYVQFVPSDDTAYADLVIFSNYAARGVPVGLRFQRFYTASFAEIQRWTQNMIPWNYTKIWTDNYHSSQQMIEVIRENLKDFAFTEDAMYDENGWPVYISSGKPRKIEEGFEHKLTLNGAGFLKWIGDGIVEPLTGGRLKREPLIEQTVFYKETGYQGIISEQYDISFSIDWIRNLASGLVSVRSGRNFRYDESGADVTISPFSAVIGENGVMNSTGFIQNTGYSVQSLKSLLYVLAATEPDTFYFAAIRETDRKSPEVNVFNDCAVFFPYFDSEGHFQCAVFKDGWEMKFEDFYARYCLDYVFLTRSKSTERFFPQESAK